jgi:hypothetical protein
MEGMEIENIRLVRAFEHAQQVSASQEGLCSNVLLHAGYQNRVRACNIQNDWTVAYSLCRNQRLDDCFTKLPFVVKSFISSYQVHILGWVVQ